MPKYLEVDQFHDPSFKVLARRLREAPQFEPFIKQATLDAEEHASLPDTAFAWQDLRLFPLHTPEQAALSYLYATAKTAEVKDVPVSVIKTLEDALDLYGVKIDTGTTKVASEENESDYLLPHLKRWKVTDASTVKLAEQALREFNSVLTLEELTFAACRLVKKAEALGVSLDVSTEKYAGLHSSDLETVRDWVEARAMVAPESFKPMYEKIAQELTDTEVITQDRKSLVKLAGAIYELDRKAGLITQYGAKLPNALETVFNTEKLAEEHLDLGGRRVALSKLAGLPLHLYSDIMGDDVIPEITSGGHIDPQKLATVLETMPVDLKRILAKQMGR